MLRVPLKLACAFTVLISIASTTLADASIGVNLLSNPNFEIPNIDGAWEGLFTLQRTSPTVSTAGGNFYWSPGEITYDTMLAQTIDLTDLGLDELRISTGGYYIQYGGLQNSFDRWDFLYNAPNDQGMIALVQQGDEIESTTDTLDWIAGNGSVNGWERSSGSVRMAGGADTLSYQFHVHRAYKTLNTSAYLDNTYVQIQEYTNWGGEWANGAKTQWTKGVYGMTNTNTTSMKTGRLSTGDESDLCAFPKLLFERLSRVDRFGREIAHQGCFEYS